MEVPEEEVEDKVEREVKGLMEEDPPLEYMRYNPPASFKIARSIWEHLEREDKEVLEGKVFARPDGKVIDSIRKGGWIVFMHDTFVIWRDCFGLIDG